MIVRTRALLESSCPMSVDNIQPLITTLVDAQTKTVEQAKATVAAARSPAYGGKRSIPPNALLWGYNDAPFMFPVWDRAAVIIQLESEEGALTADEIAAIDGGERDYKIEAVWVYPITCTDSSGLPYGRPRRPRHEHGRRLRDYVHRSSFHEVDFSSTPLP